MNIKQTAHDLVRATKKAAGYDIKAAHSAVIPSGSHKLIRTGLFIEDMPYYMEAQVRSRSGLAMKHGVFVLNGVGTIDADYEGEIGVILFNSGDKPFHILDGDRIAQLVFSEVLHPIEQVMAVERGVGGFGSTG